MAERKRETDRKTDGLMNTAERRKRMERKRRTRSQPGAQATAI
jgi:hypothetical protein